MKRLEQAISPTRRKRVHGRQGDPEPSRFRCVVCEWGLVPDHSSKDVLTGTQLVHPTDNPDLLPSPRQQRTGALQRPARSMNRASSLADPSTRGGNELQVDPVGMTCSDQVTYYAIGDREAGRAFPA